MRLAPVSIRAVNTEKCKHAWTLRYWVNGKQLEKSFKDEHHAIRVASATGSGRKLAQDFQLKLTVDKRSGDITFASHGRTGRQNFAEAVEPSSRGCQSATTASTTT